jgi:hypothetical protein
MLLLVMAILLAGTNVPSLSRSQMLAVDQVKAQTLATVQD